MLGGLLLAGLMLLLGAPRSAQATALLVTQASSVAAEGARFPAQLVPQAVSLPDDWSRTRRGYTGSVWYRVSFDLASPQAAQELLAVAIERACSHIEVQINGHRLYNNGRMTDPVARNCERSEVVALPVALLRAQGNQLDLRVDGWGLERVSAPERAGGLSALRLGPLTELAAAEPSPIGWPTALAAFSAATLAAMGALMLGLSWSQRTRASPHMYFGLLCVLWAVLSVRRWWPEAPLSPQMFEGLWISLTPWVALAAVQYLLRCVRRQSVLVEAILVGQALLVPVSLAVGGQEHTYAVSAFWTVLLVLEVSAAMVLNLKLLRSDKPLEFRWAAALYLPLALALAVHVALLLLARPTPVWLLDVLVPLLMVGIGVRALQVLLHNLRAAENDLSSFDSRVQLATAEIEANYLQMADADWRAEVVSRLGQANIEVEWHSPHDEVEQLLPARAFVQTTRILREAISNIIKHSGASMCQVNLDITGTDFVVAVQDNGKGIPLELDGRLDRGHGMSSMKHRAKQLNGQCLVESGPGYGTVIRLTLPL
jgi:two-component system sensor histidine kinase UhpB